jgi:para-aminobenzoate synthetase/4-amino-4-deoxychorismate lyase
MQAPFAVLDFPLSASRAAPTLVFESPAATVEASKLEDVRPALRRVIDHIERGLHAVGFVAYEAGPAFDPALVAHPPGDLPLLWFALFPPPRAGRREPSHAETTARLRARESLSDHARAVTHIRSAIARGDVYQVNHTMRFDVDVRGDTARIYERLLTAQGDGYGAHLHTGRFEIISASPELFFETDKRAIVCRPMKGTARRGRWRGEDDEHASALIASVKERAENVMIVDLVRNDLGRIAETGSVRVRDLFHVERRPTVLQMTSTIDAMLARGTSLVDIFTALFPCGSVTGAPKIAATRLIAELECEPRGVYCGAVGHISPDGSSTFSVAIRTLSMDHERALAEYGVGSGITWDSANAAEYDEVLAKTAILTTDLPQFSLIETLRLVDGAYARLERHLQRLEDSAYYFCVVEAAALRRAARSALLQFADAQAGEAARVRLTASLAGKIRITASPLPPSSQREHVALARTPVRAANRFLYHKTTHRAVYATHRSSQPAAFDVLLWNESGELTEFTIGNVVLELAGVLDTPPRQCGLLAGTFRAELLERGAIRERVLTRDDLARATGVWLINSVREWVPVEVSAG